MKPTTTTAEKVPWDEMWEKIEREYNELFPQKPRRYTFTYVRKKYFERENRGK